MSDAPGWRELLDPGRATDFFEVAGERPAFDAAATGFDVGTAWWLSEVARTIYRRDGRAAFFARAGLSERAAFERGGTQAALVTGGDGAARFAVLVFRGTDELRDWATNLRARTAAWPGGGRVHDGFRRELDAIWSDVGRALADAPAALFATGHSLGGALATLASARRPFARVYTFGAPRVGDAAFWRTLQAPLHRVVTEEDVVPHLPPTALGYAHGGSEHVLGAPQQPAERDWRQPHARLGAHAPVVYSARLRARS